MIVIARVDSIELKEYACRAERMKFITRRKEDANVRRAPKNIKTSASFAIVYRYLRKNREDAFVKKISNRLKLVIVLSALPK